MSLFWTAAAGGDVPDLIDDNPVKEEGEAAGSSSEGEHSGSDDEGGVIIGKKRKKSKFQGFQG